MKKKSMMTGVAIVVLVVFFQIRHAQSPTSNSIVPLPPSLKNLPTIEVEPWLQVEPGDAFENTIFLKGLFWQTKAFRFLERPH